MRCLPQPPSPKVPFPLSSSSDALQRTNKTNDGKHNREISTLAAKKRLSLPSSLYRVSTPSDFDRCPETAKVCLFVHMDSIYNEFILQRILVQRTGASTEKLIAVAHELLDNLLLLVANRSVGGGDGNSVVWIVCSPSSSSSPSLIEELRFPHSAYPRPVSWLLNCCINHRTPIPIFSQQGGFPARKSSKI